VHYLANADTGKRTIDGHKNGVGRKKKKKGFPYPDRKGEAIKTVLNIPLKTGGREKRKMSPWGPTTDGKRDDQKLWRRKEGKSFK